MAAAEKCRDQHGDLAVLADDDLFRFVDYRLHVLVCRNSFVGGLGRIVVFDHFRITFPVLKAFRYRIIITLFIYNCNIYGAFERAYAVIINKILKIVDTGGCIV